MNKGHGGRREGSGRKKGTGTSNTIKKYVDDFMENLLKDEVIKNEVQKELNDCSLLSGWLYIIKDIDRNFYKIGVTQRKNPKDRLKLYKQHQMNIDLIFIDYVDFCFELESDIHTVLDSFRVGSSDFYNCSESNILSIMCLISKHKYSKIF